MAVTAAHRFMLRAAGGKMFSAEDSARYLKELGLQASDVIADPAKGRPLLFAREFEAAGKSRDEAARLEEKLRDATNTFVRQALLNPVAPELPNWMSNPYFAPIAHLKQFVFAFNATIVDRLVHEARHGNYAPLATAAMYVPLMIAADLAKDLVSNAGEEPPYKKGWGFVDYVHHGIDRSGLTGVGAFFGTAREDIIRGGDGWESALGPTFGQVQKGAKAFTSGGDEAQWNWVVKSLPLMPAYDQWLLAAPGAPAN